MVGRERFVLHWEFIGWRLDVHDVGPIAGLGLVYNAQERTKGVPKFAAMWMIRSEAKLC